MPPAWLNVVACVSILASVASAAVVGLDILAVRRQKMAIMNLVWSITALYLGPFGLLAYWVLTRPRPGRGSDRLGEHSHGQGHGGGEGKSPSGGDTARPARPHVRWDETQ
jgi:hypothetical protein